MNFDHFVPLPPLKLIFYPLLTKIVGGGGGGGVATFFLEFITPKVAIFKVVSRYFKADNILHNIYPYNIVRIYFKNKFFSCGDINTIQP